MIYFQKGIFIYTSSRGGLQKKRKEKRRFLFFRPGFHSGGVFKVLCHRGLVWSPVITQEWWREFKVLLLLWKEQLQSLKCYHVCVKLKFSQPEMQQIQTGKNLMINSPWRWPWLFEAFSQTNCSSLKALSRAVLPDWRDGFLHVRKPDLPPKTNKNYNRG